MQQATRLGAANATIARLEGEIRQYVDGGAKNVGSSVHGGGGASDIGLDGGEKNGGDSEHGVRRGRVPEGAGLAALRSELEGTQ